MPVILSIDLIANLLAYRLTAAINDNYIVIPIYVRTELIGNYLDTLYLCYI